MSFAVVQNRCTTRWMPGLVAVLALVWGGCTLDFPIEWLEGECGDGYVGTGEQCDDGDNNSGDGCSATCTEEDGFDCTGAPSVCVTTCGDGVTAGVEQCDDGNTTPGDGCDDSCNTEVVGCGDGEIQSADGEECDDLNQTAFDGCNDQCLVEDGWTCTGAPSVCLEICGDGLVVGDEAVQGGCDDGNQDNADGCDFQCQVEGGFICVGEPSVCQTGCGDGTVAGIEVCDDSNTAPNDGCDASCQPEGGWNCDGASPTLCAEICGDGTVVGAEAAAGGCDDGNTDPDDGCAADCTEEAGYACTGEPSSCSTVCGDGITVGTEVCDDGDTTDCNGGTCRGDCSAVETGCGDGFICGGEACDDGNTDWNDGCGATCVVEAGWNCAGEPSVCDLPCNQPAALYLQSGCAAGEMCTTTAYSGGTIGCMNEGANAEYQSCTGNPTCQAGSACFNIGVGQMCLPYCDINDSSWSCPSNGADLAICLYYYPQGQTDSGICAPNQCDAVTQTGCAAGWCERFFGGVALCNTTDPQGTVGLNGACVQSNPSGPSEICQPNMLCINTGSDECLALCRLGQGDCTVPGENCNQWNPPDPVYGVCE